MRDIKFRGLDIYSEWKYGYLLAEDIDTGRRFIRVMNPENEPPRYTDYWVDSDTIGQYTGLKDRNGVEIYEGDIVELSKHMNPAEVAQTNVVKWDDKKPGWSGVFPNLVYWQLHKVIGNIHEHPNLLK